eukprot:scaffold32301_cov135-Isochrysis_galbana.AAC.13
MDMALRPVLPGGAETAGRGSKHDHTHSLTHDISYSHTVSHLPACASQARTFRLLVVTCTGACEMSTLRFLVPAVARLAVTSETKCACQTLSLLSSRSEAPEQSACGCEHRLRRGREARTRRAQVLRTGQAGRGQAGDRRAAGLTWVEADAEQVPILHRDGGRLGRCAVLFGIERHAGQDMHTRSGRQNGRRADEDGRHLAARSNLRVELGLKRVDLRAEEVAADRQVHPTH